MAQRKRHNCLCLTGVELAEVDISDSEHAELFALGGYHNYGYLNGTQSYFVVAEIGRFDRQFELFVDVGSSITQRKFLTGFELAATDGLVELQLLQGELDEARVEWTVGAEFSQLNNGLQIGHFRLHKL